MARTAREWSADDIPRHSAALAFYAVFSLAPMLVIVLAVAGHLFGTEAVRGQVNSELASLMGPKASAAVEEMVQGAMQPRHNLWAAIAGLVALFFGATSLAAELVYSLNDIWGKHEKERPSGILNWLRSRALSVGFIGVILFLLLVSLILTSCFAFLAQQFTSKSGASVSHWPILSFGIALAGEVALFAMIFKALPRVKVPWRDVWLGAILTALLFEAGKLALGWYLGAVATFSTYGAAGSVLLLLLWVYYSAMIVLTGAEFTQVTARMRAESPQPT